MVINSVLNLLPNLMSKCYVREGAAGLLTTRPADLVVEAVFP